MKTKPAILIGIAAFILTITLVVTETHAGEGAKPVVVQAAAPSLVAGPGRVEPVSEDIRLGSELSGKLKAVNVEEGNRVRRGQVLAILENADYSAAVLSAEADVRAKKA